jgi:transcriptional regulator with XRE-family HTH domain
MEDSADLDRGPNPIDRHVGLRIRMRRKELGVSQERLAESIGLTFQQVQKYERAANRVSASKLWEMARALHTSVGYFYEGLGPPGPEAAGPAPSNGAVHDFLLTSDGLELASAFPKIAAGRLRRKLLELVRVLAEEPHGQA